MDEAEVPRRDERTQINEDERLGTNGRASESTNEEALPIAEDELMAKVTVVLLEAALELIPEQIAGHPQVVRTARRYGLRPGEMLLDAGIHWKVMRSLEACGGGAGQT